MSFYGIEAWFMKYHIKDLNNVSVVATPMIVIVNFLNTLAYQFLGIFLLENLSVTHIDFSRQKFHVL